MPQAADAPEFATRLSRAETGTALPSSLVFCVTAAQIRTLVEQRTNVPENAGIVALTAEAAWQCFELRRSYLKLEDFYNAEDLIAGYADWFRSELAWAEWVDGYLQARFPPFGRSRFRATAGSLLRLQFLFDEFYVLRQVLDAFFSRIPAPVLFLWPQGRFEARWHLEPALSLCPSFLESAWMPHRPSIKSVAGSPNGAEFRVLSAPGSRRSAKRWLRNLVGTQFWSEARQARRLGIRSYLRLRQAPPSTDGSQVLLLGRRYDLDDLALALRRHGTRVRWMDNEGESLLSHAGASSGEQAGSSREHDLELRMFLREQWPAVTRLSEFWAPLERLAVGPHRAVETALSYWWHELVPEQWEAYRRTARLFEGNRFRAVVTWESGGGTLSAAALQAADAHEIPSFIYQHGSTARLRSSTWHSYLTDADTLLLYGAGTAEQVERTWLASKPRRAELRPTGSARLDSVRRSIRYRSVAKLQSGLQQGDPRPLILYVPTHFGQYGRLLHDLIGYADVSYFELQTMVLEEFIRVPKVRLVYKEFPSQVNAANPVPELIRRHIPNGISLSEPSLSELMWAVDAIIVDHLGTATGEVLLTSKQLIVYCGGSRTMHAEPPDARDLLGKRAQVAHTPPDFVQLVREFLSAGDFRDLETPDRAFLNRYVTHRDDGKAADRAAEAILLGRRRCSNG